MKLKNDYINLDNLNDTKIFYVFYLNMKLYYPNLNRNISFKSRNKNIRKADDIQRRARQVFPVLSSSYIDEFYLSGNQKEAGTEKDLVFRKLLKKVDTKILAIREVAKNRNKYRSIANNKNNGALYVSTLQSLKLLKAGNCQECAMAVLAALAANGFYNSKRVSLALELSYVDKKTGECVYKNTYPIDHSFVVTSLDKNMQDERDLIVIDSWLGFTDSVSGAKNRFKSFFTNDRYNSILSYNKSMFKLFMRGLSRDSFNFDDYELRKNFKFFDSDHYNADDFKNLGLYSQEIYRDLII